MNNDRPRQWLTIEAAAADLSVDPDTVDAMIESGKLQAKRDAFGSRVVSACSIDAAAGRVIIRGVR